MRQVCDLKIINLEQGIFFSFLNYFQGVSGVILNE